MHAIFTFFPVDTAAKWVRMLRYSSHMSVQDQDSSSANVVFPPKQDFVSWEGGGGLLTEETLKRGANPKTGITNLVAL